MDNYGSTSGGIASSPMFSKADRPIPWSERVAQDIEIVGNRLSNSMNRLEFALSRCQGSPAPPPPPPQPGIAGAPAAGCTMSRIADAQQRIDSLLSGLDNMSEQIETLI